MADTPTWLETIRAVIGTELDEVNTVLPGRVHDWNRVSQVADIEPLVALPGGGALPVVPEVPVIFPGPYWDLEDGEAGLLLVASLNWQRWFRQGEVGAPELTGRHALGNAAFLPGLVNRDGARTLPAGATVLEGDDIRLGDASAYRSVVHDRALSYLNIVFSALETWGTTSHANWAAASTSFTTTVKVAIDNMQAKISSGELESPSVKVED